MLDEKAKEIMECVFNTISAAGFMPKDIEGKVIMLDKKGGIIKIKDANCEKTLYTLTIENNLKQEEGSKMMKLIKQYKKEYKATGRQSIVLENRLRFYDIKVEFSVDHIFFTNWKTDEVVHSFEV